MIKSKVNFKGKLCLFLLIFLVCSMLTACSSHKYEKANELYESGDYKKALELYQELGNYEDAQDKVKSCEKEIGMTEKSDYEFLSKIEESILNRMTASDGDNVDYATLVNTELAYVERFKDATFYDAELKKLSDKYIEGLNIQKEALKKEYKWEYQIEWQRGIVYRYEVLKKLYENYDFLSDNKEFIGTYVSQYEDKKALLEAYEAIDADLTAQANAEDFRYKIKGNTMSCTFKNNTKYQYSSVFEAAFFDKDGTMYDSSTAVIENIKPNSSFVVEFYISDVSKLYSHGWHNYYGDVKY